MQAVDPDLFEAYEKAMRRLGRSEVRVSLTVFELFCIAQVLQFGLASHAARRLRERLPRSPTLRGASDFLELALDRLRAADPSLAEPLERAMTRWSLG